MASRSPLPTASSIGARLAMLLIEGEAGQCLLLRDGEDSEQRAGAGDDRDDDEDQTSGNRTKLEQGIPPGTRRAVSEKP